jgi:ATP-binding protein involved in chromosome partitioning
MPPGIGDAVLDLIRLVKNIEFLIVTTPSRLAFETVKKLACLLQDLKVPVIGVVENMKMNREHSIRLQTEKLGLRYLAGIAFDLKVEEAIGNPEVLFDTAIAHQIKKIISENLERE